MLGTVGEPINPEAWLWYYTVVGEEQCPIVDTFWQTETVSSLYSAFLLPCELFPYFCDSLSSKAWISNLPANSLQHVII